MESCPNCLQALPNTVQELEQRVSVRLNGWHNEIDLWYCPNCDTDLSTYWFFEDVIWYDSETKAEFVGETEYHICCDRWIDHCDCPTTMTFDDLKERMAAREYDVEDFYFQAEDLGMDCTSCRNMGEQTCPQLLIELTRLKNKETTYPVNIEPCSSYDYNADDVLKYDFKGMTPQAIKVRFPAILGKKVTTNA